MEVERFLGCVLLLANIVIRMFCLIVHQTNISAAVYVEICMLVTSSACLTNCAKQTAVFFNSETPLALPEQSLLLKSYHVLNNTLKIRKLNKFIFEQGQGFTVLHCNFIILILAERVQSYCGEIQ
jgi:hypothetical protein